MAFQAVTKERALCAIFSALDEINADRDPEDQLATLEQSILFGQGGTLDSIGLVGLILSVERKVAEAFGVAVTLADEKAMSQRNSPFRTVETLANYVTQLLEENNGG